MPFLLPLHPLNTVQKNNLLQAILITKNNTMRKFLLSFALLVAGAMTVGAQELVLTYENITAPQELSAEDATKIRGFQNGMTIVADVEITNTSTSNPPSVLFAAVADYTSNSTSNNSVWSLGFGGNQMRYIVGPRDGGWYSRGSVNTAAKKIIYTNSGNTFNFYVDGTKTGETLTVNGAPAVSTFNGESAKFYLGGLVYNNNTEWGNFNGTISKVEIYDGVLTADQIAALCYPANAVTDYTKFVHGNVYTFQTKRGWLMAQAGTDFVYSSGKLNDVTPAEDNANCQWVYYATEKGKYLYNVAVGKFVSYNSANLNSIPLSENPTTSAIEFKNSTLGGYPILLGVESKVVNHNLTNNSFTYGALLWGDGWTGYHNDEGSACLVLSQGAAPEATLSAIKSKVDVFEAVAALDAAIAKAEDMEQYIGTGVGKYSTDAEYESKFAAIKAFRAAVDTTNPTLEDVNDQTAEVEALIASFKLNMPETGKFYRLKGISGNYIDASSIYNNANATTGQMSMKSGSECNLAGTIFYFDTDNHLLSYATGTYVKETREIGAVGDAAGVWTIAESPRTGNGKYALSCTTTGGNGAHLHDNSGNRADRCSSNCGNRHDFTIEEVTELPVAIGKVGYATLYAPVALTIPAGVKAYTGALNNKKTCLTLTAIEAGSTIPAKTAVILEATETLAEPTTFNFTVAADVAAINENALSGTIEAVAKADTHYTLQSHEGGVAFKKFAGESLTGFKAYLDLKENTGAGAIGIRFEDGTTGIDNSELTIQNSELIFDLMGRRVETMIEGNIYIVNGKKVIR